jgi:NADPH-dependent 2,4-dienoyl-CoA reductase/sulfur reductase-like enzyme
MLNTKFNSVGIGLLDNDLHLKYVRESKHRAYTAVPTWSGNRIVIPPCVVSKVRDIFPDPSSKYTDYGTGKWETFRNGLYRPRSLFEN